VSIAEQRQEGRQTVIVVRDSFGTIEVQYLLDLVARLPRSARVSVDFHEARLVDDFAFATLAGQVVAEGGPRIELAGLSRHLERLLRYMGSNAAPH